LSHLARFSRSRFQREDPYMASHDRFLNSRSRIEPYAPLGRVFRVVKETWRLKDDPKTVRPKVEVLAAERSASDAADFARAAAGEQPQQGFHKASGAWWSSDGGTVKANANTTLYLASRIRVPLISHGFSQRVRPD
jgi:hypothetical protein